MQRDYNSRAELEGARPKPSSSFPSFPPVQIQDFFTEANEGNEDGKKD
jgi:hypothetical protein